MIDFEDKEALEKALKIDNSQLFFSGLPALLCPKEVALALSVSIQTVERLISAGAIPQTETTEGLIVLKSDLVAYCERNYVANFPVLADDQKTHIDPDSFK